MNGKKQIFFYDDMDVRSRYGLILRPGTVEKKGILDWPAYAWDLKRSTFFCGSILPMPDGGYRGYYSGNMPEGAMYAGRRSECGIAFAESEDGITWKKPLLGQFHLNGQDTNIILPDNMPDIGNFAQPNVVRKPDGSYQMCLWLHDPGARYVRWTSPDGIHWHFCDDEPDILIHTLEWPLGRFANTTDLQGKNTEEDHPEGIISLLDVKRRHANDACNLYYNAETQMYELYSVTLVRLDRHQEILPPNGGNFIRVIHRRESRNGIDFTAPEIIFFPDEHDSTYQEFYYLSVLHDDEWNIGFLGNYRCWEQTMDIELCFSRDTKHWVRPLRGGFIPRGTNQEIDYMYVTAPGHLIDLGDCYRVLYRGMNREHDGKKPDEVDEVRHAIMVADIQKGRFAGLHSPARIVGTLTTKPFCLLSEELAVDAEVAGRLRLEIRDPFGKPFPGYELKNCRPITGDARKQIVRWQGANATGPLQYETVTVHLEMEEGTLYSIIG